MSYGRFAYIYDKLMAEVPYEKWRTYIEDELSKNGIMNPEILDVACGTGQIAIRLAEAGYKISGIDLSEDMLVVAQEKALEKEVFIPLFQQDMRNLDLGKQFDCIGIFCDSLNYLTSSEDVQQTFFSVYKHLKPGGLFLFDVHSIYKVDHLFANETFVESGEEISYIWECFQGEHEHSVEHELSFFVLDESSRMYKRFDELHKQRTFAVEAYKKWLHEAGFQKIEVTADFSKDQPSAQSERVFFSVLKK